jgi:drug/metabolite transporter (DMT)-like permease
LTRRDLADLLLLAALWGGSFLLLRIGAPEFGPVTLTAMRAVIAAVCLLPLLWWRGLAGQVVRNAPHMLAIAVLGTALPFVLFAFALLTLSAGKGAIVNAAVPLWGALVGYLWLRERPTRAQLLGLAIGFAGVVTLIASKSGIDGGGSLLAFSAALLATASYGVAGHYTRRHLAHVDSLANAGGSLIGAALLLVVPGLLYWPATPPSAAGWAAALVLGVACTGFAYVVFFRLLANVGPARAMTVIFLVPVFGVLWGSVFLGERIDGWIAGAGLTTLAGTALAAGILRLPLRRRAAPAATRETR